MWKIIKCMWKTMKDELCSVIDVISLVQGSWKHGTIWLHHHSSETLTPCQEVNSSLILHHYACDLHIPPLTEWDYYYITSEQRMSTFRKIFCKREAHRDYIHISFITEHLIAYSLSLVIEPNLWFKLYD